MLEGAGMAGSDQRIETRVAADVAGLLPQVPARRVVALGRV
eukprot:SAG22_NODE_11540_length_480_cov_0.601050_1_plen_40_part_10